MQDLRQCEPREVLGRLGALLTRSLLLRDDPATLKLSALLDALNRGDMLLCSKAYHALLFVLADANTRRVSGDLWRDYLLHTLLTTPHAFARQAARGKVDEALSALMETELSVLGALSTLTDTALVQLAQSRIREMKLKSRQARDNIELFSTAVWSGGSARALPAAEEQKSAPPYTGELDFTSWRYGEMGLREAYIADEALEELYLRLLDDFHWETQLETLRCFFSAYGCGEFLRERAFRYTNGALYSLGQDALSPLPSPVCFPAEHDLIMDHIIRFMQGEPPVPLLISGAAGMGKSAQIFSVAYELPEVRLIVADEHAELFPLFEKLGAQPLKFLLFLDDVRPAALERRALCALPPNVLLCLASNSGENLEFARRVVLPTLKSEQFLSFTGALLEEKLFPFSLAQLQDACVNYRLEVHEQLSVAGALRLSESLRGNAI